MNKPDKVNSLQAATHCYLGTMPCGCNVAVAVDVPDDPKGTGESVRRFIADGYTVQRIPLHDLRDGTIKLGRCIHRAEQAFFL